MYIGEAGVEEPMWVYLNFVRRAQREQWFIDHPVGVRDITGLTLTSPLPLRSPAAQRTVESGLLSTRTGATSVLEIEFDNKCRNQQVDLRPHLPFIFQL
jgi:arylamine N-acetyltransferase